MENRSASVDGISPNYPSIGPRPYRAWKLGCGTVAPAIQGVASMGPHILWCGNLNRYGQTSPGHAMLQRGRARLGADVFKRCSRRTTRKSFNGATLTWAWKSPSTGSFGGRGLIAGAPMLATPRNGSRELSMQPFRDSALDIGAAPARPGLLDSILSGYCDVLGHGFELARCSAGMNRPSPKCAP